MARNQDTESSSSAENYSWSNRLLALATAGILFLTMYPFEVGHAKWHGHRPVLLLGHGGKPGGAVDVLLNILLFIPFGFGLGSKLLRSKSWKTALVYTTLAGTLFSYGIELAQLYIPARDSGWNDVITNTAGSFVGFLIAWMVAGWLFRVLFAWQQNLQAWLTPRRLLAALVVYFAVWFAGSAFLEKEASLQDWQSDCFLVFRNDATGRHAWAGTLLQVQIWDRALPNSVAERVTSAAASTSVDDPIVNIKFEENPGAQSQTPTNPTAANANAAVGLLGLRQAVTGAPLRPAENVVNSVKQTNQFSIRAVLGPAVWPRTDGRIISLSETSGISNFYLNQEADSLVFWFRTPLTARRRALAWKISKALRADGTRTVLFTYDGSAINCYIDGSMIESHPWGAGTALASYFRHYVKQAELKGYRDIYYVLVFFPAGALLGAISASKFRRRAGAVASLILVVLGAPLVLEWVLMRTSKGPFSATNLVLSVILAIAGLLWMRSDGSLPAGRNLPVLPRP